MDKKRILKYFRNFLISMIMLTILSQLLRSVSLVRVVVEETKQGTIQHEINGMATIESKKNIPVFVDEGLYVKTLEVEMGDSVNRGDVLFSVDLERLNDSIEDCKRELEICRLQLKSIQNSNKKELERNEMASKQAEETYNQVVREQEQIVNKAKEKVEEAEKEYDEYIKKEQVNDNSNENNKEDIEKQELLAAISTAKEEYEAALTTQQNTVLAAKQGKETAEIGSAENTEEQQQKILCEQINEKLVQLESIKMDNGNIRSTLSGVVNGINISVGEITTGTNVMLISDVENGLVIKAKFSDEYEDEITEGQVLVLEEIQSNDAQKLSNKYQIDKVYVDYENNELIAIAKLSENSGYRIGRSISVKIDLPEQEYRCVVPLSALRQNAKGKYYVNTIIDKETILGKENVVHSVEIEILDKDMENVAIDGVQEGLEVIIDSTRIVSEGSKVLYSE